MKSFLFLIGKRLIGLSGKENKMKEDFFSLVVGILDAMRDGEIDKEEYTKIRNKAYQYLIDYDFYKPQKEEIE
jgi:hypothetical protein